MKDSGIFPRKTSLKNPHKVFQFVLWSKVTQNVHIPARRSAIGGLIIAVLCMILIGVSGFTKMIASCGVVVDNGWGIGGNSQ
jgi:hypothetical protein